MRQDSERRAGFIGTFVNEIYAILLGIGVASVIFEKGFNFAGFDDWFGLGSAVFVALVVILYWWDWVESIETNVSPSSREVAIDLSIAGVFLAMFAFHDKPNTLAALFIALSIADLAWVINFGCEMRLKFLSNGKFRRWISLKIFAVGLFAMCCWILQCVPRIPPNKNVVQVADVVQIVMVAAAFALAYALCFGEIKKILKVIVRSADEADIADIVRIHNSHVLKTCCGACRGSFLLEYISRADVAEHLSRRRPSSVYVAIGPRGSVLGFAIVTTEPNPEVRDSEVIWESSEVREAVTRKRCHVLSVAVSASALGQGVAQRIYSKLYERYPDYVFTAFIVMKPVQNLGSLRFHEKQQFRCVGVFSRSEFRGLRDYESQLMARIVNA